MKTQILTTCTAAFLLGGLSQANAQDTKPNIIFIMADDLGYGDISCNNPDSKISTPNIDRLAANGIRFTDAHSGAALSTPTRYGVLTGRYSFRSRLKSGVLGADAAPLIENNQLTVGKFLQQNGYNTACFGKWHLGIDFPKKNGSIDYTAKFANGPITRGFDYYYGVNVNNSTFFIENDSAVVPPSVPKPEGMFGGEGMMAPGWTFENSMPTFKDKAIDYIKNTSGKRDTEKPFFIYFAATTPHTPIAPIDEFKGTSGAHLIGDFIQQFDWEVGQIMKALEDEGIADNTLIIFTSDNGPMHWDGTNMQGGSNSIFKHGHNPSYIFRGKKSDIWEAGHRVPFVAHWPEQIPANTVSDEIISLVDFMGTCAGIVGKELPKGAGEDSHNILPALKAENQEPIRKELLNYSGGGKFALRQGDWKLILAGGSGGFTAPKSDEDAAALGLPPIQLYNLAEDIAEENNLQAQYPEKVKEMTAIIDSIRYGKATEVKGDIHADYMLEFNSNDANSYVDCGSKPEFTSPNFTVELWFSVTDLSNGTTLLSNGGTVGKQNQGYTLKVNKAESRVDASVGIGNHSWVNCKGEGKTITFNTWNHVAMVHDGSKVDIYLNGELNSSTTLEAPIVASTKKLYMAEHPSFSNRKFGGYLSDVRIWSVARTEEEINSTMNQFLKGNEPGLVANWQLNQSEGTTVTDLTGKHNATKNSGATWRQNQKKVPSTNIGNPVNQENTIEVWPSVIEPGGILHIRTGAEKLDGNICIFSSTGQLVYTTHIKNTSLNNIKVENLPPGSYILSAGSASGQKINRFVIK